MRTLAFEFEFLFAVGLDSFRNSGVFELPSLGSKLLVVVVIDSTEDPIRIADCSAEGAVPEKATPEPMMDVIWP